MAGMRDGAATWRLIALCYGGAALAWWVTDKVVAGVLAAGVVPW